MTVVVMHGGTESYLLCLRKSDRPGRVMKLSMLRAHKIRLIKNGPQVTYCARAAGTARYAHNWCLNVDDAYYSFNGERLSDYDLRKLWNTHRKALLPWTYEVTKHAGDSGVDHYCAARKNWFGSLKKRKKNPKQALHFRKPKLKTKRRSKKSFTLYGTDFRVEDQRLILPKLGSVRMTERVRFHGRITSVTISEQGGHWYASFLVELSEDYVYPHRCETQAVVGIDVGLNAHLTLSTGEKEPNPKLYRRHARKIKKAQRALSRKQKGSRNRDKACHRLNAEYVRLGSHRIDHLHQMTTRVVKRFRFIGLEDLAVMNMMKNHSLAAALADARFGEIRRQLQYKAEWAGCLFTFADRFYASSKLCSVCGHKHDALKLSDREWTCPQCGTHHDRDINAARNLETLARGLRESLNACVTVSSETTMSGVAVRQSLASKDARAAVPIQECFASLTSVSEL